MGEGREGAQALVGATVCLLFLPFARVCKFQSSFCPERKNASPESRVPGSYSGARGSQGKARGGSSVGGGQLGVEGVGQIRRLGLARQVGKQVWRLLQGSRSGI